MKRQSIYKTENGRDTLLKFYDGVMGKWAFPFDTSIVETRFGQTFIVTAGNTEKPALVLLHGAASNILGWGGAIPQYTQDFRVIAPDIPGDPGRSAPVRPDWSNDDYILWMDDVLEALSIGRAALMGLSFGGWISAKYAAHRPGRVDALALLAPGGIAPARNSAIFRTVMYSMQGRRGADKIKRMIFGSGEILPEVSRFFDLLQEHYAPRFGSPPLLSDEELKAIACPVLLYSGGDDAFFDAKRTAARVKGLMPRADVNVVEGGRHGITDYSGRIMGFLCGSNRQML